LEIKLSGQGFPQNFMNASALREDGHKPGAYPEVERVVPTRFSAFDIEQRVGTTRSTRQGAYLSL
jgi:hypothetical protein